MTLYLRWLADNPTHIVCSFKAFSFLGTELMGLPLEPSAWCEECWLYGVNEVELMLPVKFLEFR